MRATDERALLETVCRIIVETGSFRLAWVGYAEDDPQRRIRPVARVGHDLGYVETVAATWGEDPRGQGPSGAAIRLGRPAVVKDVLTDPAYSLWRDEAVRRGYGSVAGLPLVLGGRNLGVLTIYAAEPNVFDAQTVEPLTELAGNLAYGIGALRLRADQRRGEQRLWISSLKQAMLNRVLHLAFEPLSLHQQLERTLREVLSVPWLPLGRAGVVCLSREAVASGRLSVRHKACDQLEAAVADLVQSCTLATTLGLAGPGARIACAAGAGGEPAFLPFCWVPIRSGARFLGVLALSLTSDRERVPDLGPEQEFLLALGSTLATLIERKEAEDQLRLYATVFASAAEGIMVTDARNRIMAVNEAFCGITGYRAEEVMGRTPRLLRSDRHDDAFFAAIWDAIRREGRWQGEIWNRRKSGEVYSEWLSIAVIRDSQGAVAHHVGVFTDVRMLKQSQARLEYLAHHDALTGLPNRLLFSARLEHAVQRATRQRQSVGLLFLDLDRFKVVNDTLGHLAGDQLLQGVAERLKGCVREQDTVARLGGDEFVVILEALADPADAALVARKVLEALESPFQIVGQEVRVTGSVGISLYPDDARDPAWLTRCADEAMYRAKQRGRRTYEFYGPGAGQARLRVTTEAVRRRAP
jgi:diguanylate cyclase (GGDEF)-like protein/PAS domain S-box-containing protein